MSRDPIENSIEVSALVVCVEVGKRHLPSRYPVISNRFIVNSRLSMPCDTHEMTPTSATHIRFCLIISIQWSVSGYELTEILLWQKLQTIPRWLRMNLGRVAWIFWISGYSFRYVNFRSMFWALVTNLISCSIDFFLPGNVVDGKPQSIPCCFRRRFLCISRLTVFPIYWSSLNLHLRFLLATLKGTPRRLALKRDFMSQWLTWIIRSDPIPSLV